MITEQVMHVDNVLLFVPKIKNVAVKGNTAFLVPANQKVLTRGSSFLGFVVPHSIGPHSPRSLSPPDGLQNGSSG